jgi:hypothetical protein
MSSISNRLPPVIVQYDVRNGRRSKSFKDAYAARRFYIIKIKAGKNPTLKKG